MKALSSFHRNLLLAGLLLMGFSLPATASPGSALERVKKTTESQIRTLVEPLLTKYCADSCRLLSVSSSVEMATPEEVAPGFDESAAARPLSETLAPSSARIKLLIDDQLGPRSREHVLTLLQQFLETLDYPVRVETQLTHFPQPAGTESKVAQLREKVIREFRSTLEELFQQFCPEQCLLADFNVQTEAVNPEESQYGKPGEFVQDAGVSLRIRQISGTILADDLLPPEEQKNVLEMARLKTNTFKNVQLSLRSMKFPHPDYMVHAQRGGRSRGTASDDAGAGSDKTQNRSLASTSSSDQTSSSRNESQETKNQSSSSTNQNQSSTNAQSSETNQRQDKFERFEKIERVESGDAVQAELQKFQVYGLVLAACILSLLVFVAVASARTRVAALTPAPLPPSHAASPSPASASAAASSERRELVATRFETSRLEEELTAVFAQHPKVAQQVFTRVLTEEGVETTARYLHIFGEAIVVDLLRDPSLQGALSELLEYYARNPQEIPDAERLELLKRLHARTVAGKLVVLGNRSSNLFDFLSEMDGLQIRELIRSESLTIQAIVLTQVDPQKRQALYAQLDEPTRLKLLTELSRIDYLPRDYLFHAAHALKRKRREHPRLNTEALPGSEVLVTLLERLGLPVQRSVMKNLKLSQPESARTVQSKLVSLETLRFLRDSQLLEVILNLRHDELLQFLRGAPHEIRQAVLTQSPRELSLELEEELQGLATVPREAYLACERKVLHRMKALAQEGVLNLVEVNERLFSEDQPPSEALSGVLAQAAASPDGVTSTTTASIRKAAGW